MKKNTLRTIAVSALILAIGALSISYAALSQILKVEANSYVQTPDTKWNIHFENASNGIITGSAEKGILTLNATNITLNGVILKNVGDSVTYTFEVVNDGNLDAKIGNIDYKNPSFTGFGETSEVDEAIVRDAYQYILTYEDGTPLTVSDVLNEGERKTLKLTITYQLKGDFEPTNDVNIDGSGVIITYVQA